MQIILQWLASSSFLLLFAVVLAAGLIARLSIRGLGLGIVASAIVAGAAISAYASAHGVRTSVDPSIRSMLFCLLVYGLGLRIGPSLLDCLKGENLKLSLLALSCSALGLAGALAFARFWDLPAGAAAGIVAGSMTLTAAIGPAEEALRNGTAAIPAGQKADDVAGMIAVAYGLTYIWGALGLIVIGKWLPRWWDVDAKAEAKRYEERLGVPNLDDAGLTGLHSLSLHAHRLANDAFTGWTVKQLAQKHPQFKVLNVLRVEPTRRAPMSDASALARFADEPMVMAAAGVASTTMIQEADTTPAAYARRERGALPETQYTRLGAGDDLVLRQGDIITVGTRVEGKAQIRNLIGPEVTDPAALNVPVEHGAILVTHGAVEGKELIELRNEEFTGQVALHHLERGGVPIPLGLHTQLRHDDVLFVAGIKSGVDKLARVAGRIVRPSATADVVTLALGMVLGLTIGAISLPLNGARVSLGNAGGLLVAGVAVSWFASRVRFLGSAACCARGVLEEFGLVAFAAIIGMEAGIALATKIPGDVALKILVAGFVTSTLTPIALWVIGRHAMKLNAASLLGAIAGARSQPAAAREAARELGSTVPWTGFAAPQAVSAILVTSFGYVAMVLAR